MAFVPETSQWEEGIRQFEVTDVVEGGPDVVEGGPDGVDNVPLKQIANRTAYLKQQSDVHTSDITALKQQSDVHTSDVTALEQQSDVHTSDITALEQQSGIQATDITALKTWKNGLSAGSFNVTGVWTCPTPAIP